MSNPDSEEAREPSDEEILRKACFPDDVAREMSANEKKKVADEIRRSAGGRSHAAETPPRPPLLQTAIMPKANQRRSYFWPVFCCLIAVPIIYRWMFGPATQLAEQLSAPAPPGWDELLDCSYTKSLDGTKQLELLDNQTAVLSDTAIKKDGEYRTATGNWEFDQTSKRYAITLSGEVTAYSIAKPTGICMLVKGDLGAADLRASWFSSNDDEPVDDDRERPSQSE
jgi:hypothetical protein